MYLDIDDIKEIQIDHTSRCNLGCPQCARTQGDWSQRPENKNLDLTLDDYKILLSAHDITKMTIFHCGNFGDALASPTFDETFLYTMNQNPNKITIATNGALRSKEWWADLAQIGGQSLRVNFAIDGLQDTNHFYRVGASWKKLIENATAYIKAGGRARWDFIEFEHNFHQIQEAEALARDLGFESFNVKYTARFATNDTLSEKKKDGAELRDRDENVNQTDLKEIKTEFSSFNDYVNKTKIKCKYQLEKKVFVDMHMKLWPCCWLGAPRYLSHESEQARSFQHFTKLYGVDFNSLRKFGWDVLKHPFYKTYLENSWENPNEEHKRIYTCGRTCGEKFEFSSGYGKNQNIKVIQ